MRIIRTLAWMLDEALDRIPRYENGRWYRYGQWGCQLGLPEFYNKGDGPYGSKIPE